MTFASTGSYIKRKVEPTLKNSGLQVAHPDDFQMFLELRYAKQ